MVVNTETIAGKVITQNLGVVGGSTVRAKHIGKDIGALFKNIVPNHNRVHNREALRLLKILTLDLSRVLKHPDDTRVIIFE